VSYFDPVLKTTSEVLRPPKLEGDVGFDLPLPCKVTVGRGRYAELRTGIRVELPPNTWGLVVARSNANCAPGLIIKPSVIDCGYRGELMALVENVGDSDIDILAGEAVIQLVVLPMVVPKLTLVDTLSPSERGSRGFGSTCRWGGDA
jgi:dUTP pyrophosphatase